MRLVAALALLALVGCSHSSAGLSTHHLVVDGLTRSWYEYRPPHLPAGRVPVVVAFHGFLGSPLDLLQPTGLDAEAGRDGFLVVLPVGVNRSWNAGSCCGHATTDDVRFTSSMLSSLITRGIADPARVYAIGFSNGGMFAYRLGCELTTAFAGIGVVEGTMTAPCPAHRPVNLVVIHQLGDAIVPYEGLATVRNNLGPFVSVPASIEAWERSEDCSSPTLRRGLPTAVVVCPSGATVELAAIPGGSHTWPASAAGTLADFFGLR